MSADVFPNGGNFKAVLESVRLYRNYEDGDAPGPFARPGWFSDLCLWISRSMGTVGCDLTGAFCQWNASPTFSLIRFETTGPAVWFKAVGELHGSELPVTALLAQRIPGYATTILATRPECNGWLSLEAPGASLAENPSSEAWLAAAAALADLQLQALPLCDQLLGSGARDLRSARLGRLITPFFREVGELMEEQAKVPPKRLSDQELLFLEQQTRNAMGRLDDLNLPDTLGQLDINPGNIVLSSQGCRFLDWAEAYVGPGFFTFLYLQEHLRRCHGLCAGTEEAALAAFLEPWQNIVSRERMQGALPWISLLAVFAYAAGSAVWSEQMKLRNRLAAGYVRCLARRMMHHANEFAGGQ
ncbi:MAG TPA: hypothetical protein VGG15_01450 [Terriglobales bacterium]